MPRILRKRPVQTHFTGGRYSLITAISLIGLFSPDVALIKAAEFRFTKVFVMGDSAPGTSANTGFASVYAPALGASGHVVFNGLLTGEGVTTANDWGIWLGRPGAVALVMREGDPVPGMQPGVTYASAVVGVGAVNAAGQTAFSARLVGPGINSGNSQGAWIWAPGNLRLLARSGEQAPGTPAGTVFTGFYTAALNAVGQVVVRGGLTGPGVGRENREGWWSGSADSGLALLARAGDQAVGAPPGAVHDWYIGLLAPITINAAGQSTFYGRAGGGGTWLGAPGSVSLLAYDGYPAPGTEANFSGSGVGTRAAINGAGQSVFPFSLSGTGVTTENNNAVWLGSPGQLQVLVRKGDAAPGMPAGVTYAELRAVNNNPPVINALGQVAFHGKVAGTGISTANDWGIWRGTVGNIAKVVSESDIAPGAGGAVFGDTSLVELSINDRGDVVFPNVLAGSGVNSTNDGSLWLANAAGTLSLIIREGDSLEIAPGVHRIVSTIAFVTGSGDEDGRPCGINDKGQVAFLATFTDGTHGIFVATPALQPIRAVSRKAHGSAGNFDIELPFTGNPGVECRSSNDKHTVIVSFTNDVVSGEAVVIAGKGVAGPPTFEGNTMTVGLSEAADVQSLAFALSGVTDHFGQVHPVTNVRINLLAGDTNGNRTVNATDLGQTKAQSGAVVTDANFRQDVVPSGTIGASDIGLVKSRAGGTLP